MKCFLGIKTHTALSLIVETGDFERFAKGNQYASYLGLAPGENSSSDSIHRLGITKAGNSHLRQLLIEASSGICKGAVGHKSKFALQEAIKDLDALTKKIIAENLIPAGKE